MDQASDVFKLNEDHELLLALKSAGIGGLKDKVDEFSVKFEEHSDQLQEVITWLKLFIKIWIIIAIKTRHYIFGNEI